MHDAPTLAIIAGPNGAGKSTVAPLVLQDGLHISEFLNADTIARGLSAFDPDRVAIQAGRILLSRIDELVKLRADFAFETTLSTRSFAPALSKLRDSGYLIKLYYVWISSAELAVERVALRVRQGGHSVPAETIRRRFARSIDNLFELYMPLSTRWSILDNTPSQGPELIASGGRDTETAVFDLIRWDRIRGDRAFHA